MSNDDMTSSPEALLAMQFGGANVGDNIATAIAEGRLVEHPDGSLSLPLSRQSNWAVIVNRPRAACGFRTKVLFEAAYGRSAVPNACSGCYKVKVRLSTLRELVAAWKLAKQIDCLSKWGLDLGNPFSQDIYAGYFFLDSLEDARALYPLVRERIDQDPLLGAQVGMRIKRGCSQFEAAVGPADEYAFAPRMAELEAYLWSRFKPGTPGQSGLAPLARWIDLAFRIGDDTYLDFTGGQRLRPETVSFEP